jgi:hypothetical protein
VTCLEIRILCCHIKWGNYFFIQNTHQDKLRKECAKTIFNILLFVYEKCLLIWFYMCVLAHFITVAKYLEVDNFMKKRGSFILEVQGCEPISNGLPPAPVQCGNQMIRGRACMCVSLLGSVPLLIKPSVSNHGSSALMSSSDSNCLPKALPLKCPCQDCFHPSNTLHWSKFQHSSPWETHSSKP